MDPLARNDTSYDSERDRTDKQDCIGSFGNQTLRRGFKNDVMDVINIGQHAGGEKGQNTSINSAKKCKNYFTRRRIML